MDQPEAQPDPYALWKTPDYRHYAVSWFLIVFSRRVEFIAISVYLTRTYDARTAALALGILALVQALPAILLSVPGGQLADRFNRHRVMTLAFSLGVVSAAGLLATVWLGGSIELLYLAMMVGSIGGALGGPSRQAMLPQMIPPELFSTGVAWNSTVFYTAWVVGPIIGGGLMAVAPSLTVFDSMALAFGLALWCRTVAIALILRIRCRPGNGDKRAASWKSVVAGIRFVWSTKPILATITLDMFAVLLGGVTYLLPVYAEKILHVGSLGLGALQSADAVGAICMAIFLAHRRPLRRPGVTLLWAVAGFGTATIVFGVSMNFWLSLSMMFVVGALDNISVVVRHTLVQMLTPDAMRGRVSAVNSVFITASNELGGMESGFVAWLFTPVISVVAGGIGTILVVLGVWQIWPQVLKIGSLDSIQPVAPTDDDREA
jgi:MFS family permease